MLTCLSAPCAASLFFSFCEGAIFIPLDYYVPVVSWVLQRHALSGGRITKAGLPGIERQPFSVLVHPNTGCQYTQTHACYSAVCVTSSSACVVVAPLTRLPVWASVLSLRLPLVFRRVRRSLDLEHVGRPAEGDLDAGDDRGGAL
jgi:hypothetical protein